MCNSLPLFTSDSKACLWPGMITMSDKHPLPYEKQNPESKHSQHFLRDPFWHTSRGSYQIVSWKLTVKNYWCIKNSHTERAVVPSHQFGIDFFSPKVDPCIWHFVVAWFLIFSVLFLEVSRISSVMPFNHKLGATLICGILIQNWQLHDIENAYYTYSV